MKRGVCVLYLVVLSENKESPFCIDLSWFKEQTESLLDRRGTTLWVCGWIVCWCLGGVVFVVVMQCFWH